MKSLSLPEFARLLSFVISFINPRYGPPEKVICVIKGSHRAAKQHRAERAKFAHMPHADEQKQIHVHACSVWNDLNRIRRCYNIISIQYV